MSNKFRKDVFKGGFDAKIFDHGLIERFKSAARREFIRDFRGDEPGKIGDFSENKLIVSVTGAAPLLKAGYQAIWLPGVVKYTGILAFKSGTLPRIYLDPTAKYYRGEAMFAEKMALRGFLENVMGIDCFRNEEDDDMIEYIESMGHDADHVVSRKSSHLYVAMKGGGGSLGMMNMVDPNINNAYSSHERVKTHADYQEGALRADRVHIAKLTGFAPPNTPQLLEDTSGFCYALAEHLATFGTMGQGAEQRNAVEACAEALEKTTGSDTDPK